MGLLGYVGRQRTAAAHVKAPAERPESIRAQFEAADVAVRPTVALERRHPGGVVDASAVRAQKRRVHAAQTNATKLCYNSGPRAGRERINAAGFICALRSTRRSRRSWLFDGTGRIDGGPSTRFAGR